MSGMTHVIHEGEEFLSRKTHIRKQDLSVVADHLQAVVCCLDDYQKALKPLLAMQKSLTHTNEQDSAHEQVKSYSLGRLISELEPQFSEAAKSKGRKPCFLINDVPHLELGSKLYLALQSALLHMVSNSIDHGLESPEVRKQKGKPESGILTFFIDSSGRLGFKDDGQGISLEKVRQKAASRGLTNLGTAELLELLFHHGFSTRDTADHAAGRGVGLDAALSFLTEAGSNLEIIPTRDYQSYVEFYFAMKIPTS
jgi:two-component system chemotaxis sensor kinase CheA